MGQWNKFPICLSERCSVFIRKSLKTPMYEYLYILADE